MFHRRSIALAIGMLAGFGAIGSPSETIGPPPWSQGVTRRAKTPRRAFARMGAPLPGKKGQAQKHQGKTCRHRKAARARRRSARVKRR